MVLRSDGDTLVDVSFTFLEFTEVNGDLELLQATSDITQIGANGIRFVMSSDWSPFSAALKAFSPKPGSSTAKVDFTLSANCSLHSGLNRTNACRKDGDATRTVVSMKATDQNGLANHSNVSLTARVEALPSCELTSQSPTINTVVVDHLSSTGLTASVAMMDVDNLPIQFTRPLLKALWKLPTPSSEESLLPYESNVREGKHEPHIYLFPIKADQFNTWAGTYQLTVTLFKGWSSERHAETSCVVLDRAIQVGFGNSFLIPSSCWLVVSNACSPICSLWLVEGGVLKGLQTPFQPL